MQSYEIIEQLKNNVKTLENKGFLCMKNKYLKLICIS